MFQLQLSRFNFSHLTSKISFLIIFFSFLILSAQSCKSPFPCFVVSEEEDSIPVNKEVYFNAICSDNAKEFFWDFPNDSIAYGELVSYTFRDTGIYTVRLMVAGTSKSRNIQKTLTVKQP